MLNVLVPMSGPNRFKTEEYPFPKPLIEINGHPLIERVVNKLDSIEEEKRFIFVVNQDDCRKYHIDNTLRLVTNDNCEIIRVHQDTKGAACSCLLAIDYIQNDNPLIIANSDTIIESDINTIYQDFQQRKLDAGTICFESVHPKWSFVRLDDSGRIVETAEKRPLSKNAIAGFYYFQRGRDFVSATMAMIEKDASFEGFYYIAPSINELVLKQKKLEISTIPSNHYHHMYSPHKVQEYESHLRANENRGT